MQHATCNMQHATCNMQHTTCSTPSTVTAVLHEPPRDESAQRMDGTCLRLNAARRLSSICIESAERSSCCSAARCTPVFILHAARCMRMSHAWCCLAPSAVRCTLLVALSDALTRAVSLAALWHAWCVLHARCGVLHCSVRRGMQFLARCISHATFLASRVLVACCALRVVPGRCAESRYSDAGR